MCFFAPFHPSFGVFFIFISSWNKEEEEEEEEGGICCYFYDEKEKIHRETSSRWNPMRSFSRPPL